MRKIFGAIGALAIASLLSASSFGALVETNYSTSNPPTANADTAYDSFILNNDLVNNGQPTLSSVSITAGSQGFSNAVGAYDGSGGTNSTNAAYFSAFPGSGSTAALAFTLNTSGADSAGYNISEIQSFAGWNASEEFSDQTYTIMYTKVGETPGSYSHTLTSVNYLPFVGLANGSQSASTRVVLNDSLGGSIATGVSQIEFVTSQPVNGSQSDAGWQGTVYREFDVVGTAAAVPEPASMGMLLAACGVMALRWRRAL
jgi:hypothetical protein